MGLFSKSVRLNPSWPGQPELTKQMPEIDDIANGWLDSAGWTYDKLQPFVAEAAHNGADLDANPFAGAFNAATHVVLDALSVAAANFAKLDDRAGIEAILQEQGSRPAFTAVLAAIDAKTGKAKIYGEALLRHIDEQLLTATPVVVGTLRGLHQ